MNERECVKHQDTDQSRLLSHLSFHTSFINNIDNYGMRAGIVKVVPPKEWCVCRKKCPRSWSERVTEARKDFSPLWHRTDLGRHPPFRLRSQPHRIDSLVSVSEPLKDTVIRDSIEQNFMGSRGLFRQSNIASRRAYNVKQWKEMCDSEKYRTPNFFNVEEEDKKPSTPVTRKRREPSTRSSATTSSAPSTRGRKTRKGRFGRRIPITEPDKEEAPAPTSEVDPAEATPGGESARPDQCEEGASGETKNEATGSSNGTEQACGIDVDMDTMQDPEAADAWEKGLKDAAKGGHAAAEDNSNSQAVQAKPENLHTEGAKESIVLTSGDSVMASSATDTATVTERENVAHPSATDTDPAKNVAPAEPAASEGQAGSAASAKASTPAPEEPATATAPATAEKKSGRANPKRKTKAEEAEEWEREWKDFDYTTLPWKAKPEDFTVEECRKIERLYWKRFSLGAPPMYGADGSGEWNVGCLPFLYSVDADSTLMLVQAHSLTHPRRTGTSQPLTIFSCASILICRCQASTRRICISECGERRVSDPSLEMPPFADITRISTFAHFSVFLLVATVAWHVEDADLYSINYIHFGAPKYWYSVPQEHAERFERVMAGYFPRDRQKCPEFMRHKSFLVSPTNLAKEGIPLNRVVQFPGEIILTYPYGYHSGFNMVSRSR